MKGKKSFLLYCDQISLFEHLPDEKAGQLIKIIFDYVNDKDPKIKDLLLKVALEPIKLQLKRDLKIWEDTKEDRSNSGHLGNLKRWHPNIYNKVIKGKITLEEGVEESQRIAKDRTATDGIASVAVNVNDTVNDTVTDNTLSQPDLKKPGTASFEEKFRYFILVFNETAHRVSRLERKFKGDTKTKTQFKARLKEGYTSKDFEKAVENLYKNPKHRDNGFIYATPELITRANKLQMYLNAKY